MRITGKIRFSDKQSLTAWNLYIKIRGAPIRSIVPVLRIAGEFPEDRIVIHPAPRHNRGRVSGKSITAVTYCCLPPRRCCTIYCIGRYHGVRCTTASILVLCDQRSMALFELKTDILSRRIEYMHLSFRRLCGFRSIAAGFIFHFHQLAPAV